MDHITNLENTSIHILREAYANFRNLGMLWSIGKDSTVLLWLSRKAFFGHVPFPLVHIDTHFKIPEMIEYRDRLTREWKLPMVYGENKTALEAGQTFPDGAVDRINCCRLLKSEALKHTLNGTWPRYRFNHEADEYQVDKDAEAYTGVIVGVRSDEEGSRSKERYFSPRDRENTWDVGDQPPEFWSQFKTDFAPGTHVRIHPLLDWTETNIWEYIDREKIRNRLENRESLLSTLSHEIRTPLTIVQSSVDMILESRTGPVNAIQAKFLQSTATNIRRLITISENILTSIKVEKTWFKVTPVPLDIRKTVIDVADQLEGILSGKNQKLKYSFPKRLPRPFADEQWIQQVLINLVHNSSKHLEHGGTIIISVVENELCIVVSVSDNGSGMSELDRMKAFSEFYQGNVENVTREMDGFGLGLTIVKRVIEKHGGKVYVGSVESLGTTVSFTLPKKEAPDG